MHTTKSIKVQNIKISSIVRFHFNVSFTASPLHRFSSTTYFAPPNFCSQIVFFDLETPSVFYDLETYGFPLKEALEKLL